MAKNHKNHVITSAICPAVILAVGLLFAQSAQAMDRFTALAMIESGDRDNAIGLSGEVSRFQIMPAVWREYTTLPLYAATNPFTALNIAQSIMAHRLHGANVTDFQWYLFWHCPARIHSPTIRESAAARRFANLCSVR